MDMSKSSKLYLRQFMLDYFHVHKSAAEAHKLICDGFGENIVSLSDCETWFNRFDSSDKDISQRRVKIDELKAICKENPHLTQEELAKRLGTSKSTIERYLKKINEVEEKEKQVDKQVDRVFLVQLMLDYFHNHKSAAEAQRLICEEYGENIVSLSNCERWFNRFDSGDENISKRRVKIEELKEIRQRNLKLTQEELAKRLGTSKSTIERYLKKINEVEEKEKQVDKQVDRVFLVQLMLDYFHNDKNAAEAQRLICEEYGENIVSLSNCERWFNRFDSGDENISKRRVKIDELKAICKENPHLTQVELAERLGTSRSTIKRYLRNIKEEEKEKQVDKQVDRGFLDHELMLDYFHKDGSAKDAQRLICEEYGETIVSLSDCERWFNSFCSDDLDILHVSLRRMEIEELKAMRKANPHLTQVELAERLGISQSSIRDYLKEMREMEE